MNQGGTAGKIEIDSSLTNKMFVEDVFLCASYEPCGIGEQSARMPATSSDKPDAMEKEMTEYAVKT